MKETNRTMTLRGTIPCVFNANFDSYKIFEYANVLDLNKAWKVDGYACWLQGYRNEFQASNDLSKASIESFLATDINIKDTAIIFMNNSPQDNRQIAWGNTLVDLGSADKVNNTKVQSVLNESYWIDPDHIVQDELNLNLRLGGSDVEEGSIKRVNYIVYLREVTITDEESIIMNIKGKSQDLSS